MHMLHLGRAAGVNCLMCSPASTRKLFAVSNQSPLPLVPPRCVPALDAQFRPARWPRGPFATSCGVPVRGKLSGSPRTDRWPVHHFFTEIFSDAANQHEANHQHLERIT